MDGMARAKTIGLSAAVISGLAMLMGIAAAHAGGEAQTVANLGMAIGVAVIIVGAQMAMTTLVICTVRKRDEAQTAALAAALATVRQDLRELGAMVLRAGRKPELAPMAIQLEQITNGVDHLLLKRVESDAEHAALREQVAELTERQETMAAMLVEQRGGRLLLQIPNQEIYELGKKVGAEQPKPKGHDQTS